MTRLEALQARGIRRKGTPEKGFWYVDAQGRRVTGAARERIEALKIPPAWTDVYVSPTPSAALQAVGRDKAGRWQYRYHPRFSARQAEKKYQRLLQFAEALPAMRRTVDAHLRQRGLGHDRVMAALLKILATCFVRPGSAVYAEENGSFGLATLRRKHVKVKGDVVVFDFPGKHGQPQHRELRDRRVAQVVRACLALPGKEVFKYVTDDGVVVDVRRRGINAYIKSVMGEDFSAKDFRTWAGTLLCACALARAGFRKDEPPRLRKKKVVAAIRETAEHLGNTPAICRASYIYPSVLSSFEKGRVLRQYHERVEELADVHGRGLSQPEQALLELLRDGVGAA